MCLNNAERSILTYVFLLAQNTHYDVRTEIRNLGTGFYRFSLEEEMRKEQMESIKKIHMSTDETREKLALYETEKKIALEKRRKKIYDKYVNKKRKLDVGIDDQNKPSVIEENSTNISENTVNDFIKNIAHHNT